MSFGFSVGDILAVGKLIKDITSCLQDAGGAKDEYQELLRELESLHQALQHLDKLQTGSSSSRQSLESIKYAALSCRRPLETFLAKIQKYESTLGVWGKSGVMKGTATKLGWGLNRKEEVKKLQAYLNVHIGTINVLLAEYGLERMEIASDKITADQLRVRERLENTQDMIQRVDDNLGVQTLMVGNVRVMLERMFEMISGELMTSCRSLREMVARVCVSTQQSYAILVEIKSSLQGPDTRWTYFQEPLVVEDALGCKFPVPSEYDYDLLEAVTKQRFIAGPGALEVRAGNYEYFNTKSSDQVILRNSRLLPGTAIKMAILVVQSEPIDEACPMPGCGSIETAECAAGERKCCKCQVWFSPAKKKWTPLENLIYAISASSNSTLEEEHSPISSRTNKRTKISVGTDDVTIFKNVRVSIGDILGNSEPQFERLDEDEYTNSVRETSPSTNLSNNALSQNGTPPSTNSNGSIEDETVTFDQALSYVNKIKNRYASQPGTYGEFLKMLQAYQRECMTIQQVYARVEDLFESEPDMVAEFAQFLPESAAERAKERAGMQGCDRKRKREVDEGGDDGE